MSLSLTSELVEQRAGSSLRTVIDLPHQLVEGIGLEYDSNVRVSIGTFQHPEDSTTRSQPPLLIFLETVDCGCRSNDFRVTSNSYIPLPSQVVTALGLRGSIEWLVCCGGVLGRLTRYHDGTMLYRLASEYSDDPVPVTTRWDTEQPPETNFSLLRRITTSNTEGRYPIRQSDASTLVAHAPAELPFENGEDVTFSMAFVDGWFLITLTSTDESPDYEELASHDPARGRPPYADTLDDHQEVVTLNRSEDGGLTYNIPTQVAETLWLDDDYTQEWVSVGNLAVSKLSPGDSGQSHPVTPAPVADAHPE